MNKYFLQLKKLNYQKGQALLISLVFFTSISLAITTGLVVPTVNELKVSNTNLKSKQSYLLAESGLEDAYLRIKRGDTIDPNETIILGGNRADTTISSPSADEKVIEAVGDVSNHDRTLAMTLSTDTGISFNYGVQVGAGGLHLDSGQVNGNVYANGPITGTSSGSNRISGTAISANSPSSTTNQSNGTGNPTHNVNFGNNNSTQDIAQSFRLTEELPLNKVQLYLSRTLGTAPADATVTIRNDSSGSPGSTIYATGTLSASTVTTTPNWIDVSFTSNPTLDINTTYWVVVDASTNASRYYTIGGNLDGYASGVSKIGRVGTSWSSNAQANLDYFFKIYLGGLYGSIIGAGQYTQLPIGTTSGTAQAHTVNYVHASGNIYCQSGTGNNKACINQADPVYIAFPISEANIEAWKAEAEAGGVLTGNYTVGWAGATLGPKKIVGNLTVSGGGILTVSGNLWVTGNIDLSGGGTIRLASSYGTDDGVIVNDGTVSISGGGSATGSGTSGSYLMILTTNTSTTAAASISGGAGAVILYAPYGTLTVSGGAALREAVAYRMTIGGGSSITYEAGLTNNNFSSGPSGTWNVNSWREDQ
ncbi:MAG: hypothetical protein KBD14_00570 [Candidatus Pacebacteria bacterium]|nr:hypothetical protein [Candidatus Paceibacterota bacterium]